MNGRPTYGTILIGRTTWILQQFRKQLWVRAALFSVAAVLTAALAAVADRYIPYEPNLTLAAGSVDHILDILASSMLAVTTFSLSVMVAAYSAATSNVTPRSTKLLLDDSVAQNTLATFVGSFLFSIVGIIGLAAGLYGEKGRIILFLATLVVIALIAGALLVWIEQLGKFGRVGDTIARVTNAAIPPATFMGGLPRLGAQPAIPIPGDAAPITIAKSGYVEHIDMSALSGIADENEIAIHLSLLPGAFIHPCKPLAHVSPPPEDSVQDRIAACFTTGDDREFDQDPRFGLIVLSEIASRALSPAVNDPGTAIEVIDAGVRVLIAFADARADREEPRFERVHAPDIEVEGLFDDFFNPIARDGASLIEVQIRLQSALETLQENAPDLYADESRKFAKIAMRRALGALTDEHDKKRLKPHAAWASRKG